MPERGLNSESQREAGAEHDSHHEEIADDVPEDGEIIEFPEARRVDPHQSYRQYLREQATMWK